MYIIIVGCGRVGSELAKLLTDARHNVVVIDKDASTFGQLGNDFNGVTMTGDGFDVDLLKEAGIEHADAFCSVTDNDNVNVMSGQVAKKIFHIDKVVTRLNDSQYSHIYQELGIETVSSTLLLASMVRNKIIESRFSTLLLRSDELSVMEIEVTPEIVGKTIEDLNVAGEVMITAIIKSDGSTHIPSAQEMVTQEDTLIGVVKTESVGKIKKTLGLK